jgi:hypothetical protein
VRNGRQWRVPTMRYHNREAAGSVFKTMHIGVHSFRDDLWNKPPNVPESYPKDPQMEPRMWWPSVYSVYLQIKSACFDLKQYSILGILIRVSKYKYSLERKKKARKTSIRETLEYKNANGRHVIKIALLYVRKNKKKTFFLFWIYLTCLLSFDFLLN